MNNFTLYAISTLIWGSTWLAITFQLGSVDSGASVAYRFALAGVLLLIWCKLRKLRFSFSRGDHAWIALLGLAYAGNYGLIYYSEAHISSGLVAVAGSSMLFINIALARFIFGTRPTREMVLGSLLGMLGIVCVFWPELAKFTESGKSIWILGWPVLASFASALANMIATRNGQAGLPVLPVNALWMLWTALFTAVLVVLRGASFSFDWSVAYIGSLLYLAVFGSVIAFAAYLTLVNRIGSSKATYIAVVTPIIALILSTLFEDFSWHATTWFGVALSLLGNLLVIRRKAVRPSAPTLPANAKPAEI